MKRVLYPGSFDPVTNGHLDIVERASGLFDQLLVAVAVNETKATLFSTSERTALLESVCRRFDNVEVVSFEGLLVDAIKTYNVRGVIRGLRAVSDFEYEFQMALMNRELDNDCETLFMMPNPRYSFVSSRLIKEIHNHGGDIRPFVPNEVMEALKRKRGDS